MPSVKDILSLSAEPVAVAFLDAPPLGVPKYSDGEVPAGCSFWRLAGQGASFYTAASDHYNCAVGCHTHRIALPPERAVELEQAVALMVGSSYISIEEVPAIPALAKSPAFVAYGPAGRTSFLADVVITGCKPSSAMLLYEAALRAGAGSALTNSLGRPGCAALPLTQNTGLSALSFGCAGNRLFTGLPNDELYFTVPGTKWPAVVEALDEIIEANRKMGAYYESKLTSATA